MMTICGGQLSIVLDMMLHFRGKLAYNEFERHHRKSAMKGPTWHMSFGIQFSGREYSDHLSLHESPPLVTASLVNFSNDESWDLTLGHLPSGPVQGVNKTWTKIVSFSFSPQNLSFLTMTSLLFLPTSSLFLHPSKHQSNCNTQMMYYKSIHLKPI